MAVHRGNGQIYTEDNLTIDGNKCTVYGRGCKVKGHGNNIYGDDAVSDGTRNHLRGFGSKSIGPRNIIYQDDCIEIGGMGNVHKVDTSAASSRKKSEHINNFLRGLIVIVPYNGNVPPQPAPAHPAPGSVPSGVDVSTDDPSKQCVVCLDNEKQCAPSCGHRCLCFGCAGKIVDRKCPLCRKTFTRIQQIFN